MNRETMERLTKSFEGVNRHLRDTDPEWPEQSGAGNDYFLFPSGTGRL